MAMVDDTAVSVTMDDVVRRLLLARVDDAYRLATYILHDPPAAEDAVQEAALLAWDRRGRSRQRGRRWLVHPDPRQRLSRRAPAASPPTGRHGHRPRGRAWVTSNPDGPDLGPAISRLTSDEQALLALRFGSELTVPQIADRLGIPEGTVKSRLHATLQHLRAALDAERRSEEATR